MSINIRNPKSRRPLSGQQFYVWCKRTGRMTEFRRAVANAVGTTIKKAERGEA